MPGIQADANIEGHVQFLLRLLNTGFRKEFWVAMQWATPGFSDVGLSPDAKDTLVWQTCQKHELVLITANRNADEPDSLEQAIRTLNTSDCLPVLTLADADRILTERSCAERVADQLLQYLFDIDKHRGAGRLYLP